MLLRARSRLVALGLATIVATLGSGRAWADAAPSRPPTAQELADAKKFFDAGLKLYKEGLYQEALAAFLEAYRIAPRESIQRNIAQSYRDMKDFASAYEAYDELLTRFGSDPKMKPALKADARRAMEELSVLTGLVTVGVKEPGAQVTFDGKARGETPLDKPIRANIGAHTLTVTKAGFEPLKKDITLRGHDEVVVDDALLPEVLTGHVKVTTAPADATAQVIVDGAPVGPPPWQGDLDPGSHVFEARSDTAMTPAPRAVDVAKGGTYDVVLELKSQNGTVAVTTPIADSEITVDGAVVGRGAWEGALSPGRHELSVVKAGFLPFRKVLLVHAGERLGESVTLVPEPKVAAAPDYRGVYAHVALAGLLEPTTPSNDVSRARDLTGADVSAPIGLGGALDVRIGYSFGQVGLEGAVIGTYDHASADVHYPAGITPSAHPGPTPRDESYDVHRFGGTAALGVRWKPKTQTVRPTLGLAAGAAFKGGLWHLSGNGSSYLSDVGAYVAPSLVVDGGVELGTTPGTRFYVGVLAIGEVARSGKVTSSGGASATLPKPPNGIAVAHGVDLFVGPVVGLHFGE